MMRAMTAQEIYDVEKSYSKTLNSIADKKQLEPTKNTTALERLNTWKQERKNHFLDLDRISNYWIEKRLNRVKIYEGNCLNNY